MKKSGIWLTALAVLIILGVGLYAVYHKSAPKSPATTSTSTNNSANTATVNNSVVTTKSNSSVGNYLADPNGKTLYTIASGTTGVSDCSGACLQTWPVYQDKAATTGLPTNVSTIKRSDNSEIQFTYKGMPLYYFASDSSGSVSGNGVSGFSVATP